MNFDPASDSACLQALQHGQDAALNQLIARWQRPLFTFAWRYVQNQTDAHDLVAEAFVRLHQQRNRLRPDTRLSAWLFATLSNLCHNHYRWRRRHPTVSLDAPIDDDETPAHAAVPSDASPPNATLEQAETRAAVRAAIGRLPHDLRMTILLHHYERLSYREIGAIAGCSERGVETRLYRARQRLREELAGILREAVESQPRP
ncbi:MAG: sigma-70 family RNA polymerase sigma factor [Opitutaceae bacterium]|nr:sigma-70 family RNA polymerase sigma factor [Opitutaceae bacterium]